MVFDAPRQARAFFEALIADNLDLGRPEHVELLFKRDPRGGDRRAGRRVLKTAIDRNNQGVTINAFWRHFRVKQYLKDGRALRAGTVVDSPDDLGVARRLPNLPELQARARAVSTRLLRTEKVGQGCAWMVRLARISQPTLTGDGRRAPGLRFGDPRVMALAGALASTLCAVTGITNESLRALITGLLGAPYSMNQASYDLARLSRDALITRFRTATCMPSPPTACGSRFLHQSARPPPAPAHGGRPAPGAAPAPRRPPRHRRGSHPAPSRCTATSTSLTSSRSAPHHHMNRPENSR